MRYLHSYDWEKILNEPVPRTMITLDMIAAEQKAEKQAMEKSKRK